jgi:prepilin-type N-terminal cleavage/methylation domain-containing protein
MITKDQFGFSLIELLVVIAIFAILASLALFFSIDFFRTYATTSEETTLVSTLSKARSQSLANINGHPHGVRVLSDKYIIFETTAGVSFDARPQSLKDLDQSVPVGSSVHPQAATDILFDQVSGNATCSAGCTITMIGGNSPKTIVINAQGAILW